MNKGIKIEWYVDANQLYEIECIGIDVDDLDNITEFATTRAYRPEDGSVFDYKVDTRCERPEDDVVHLVVKYAQENNTHLENDGDIVWGTNTIVLKRGKREGESCWLRCDETKAETIRWEAFDVEGNYRRPLARYLGSRRQRRFRDEILACDENRCVLTGEGTARALEAAHLVPARNGENDLQFNGITLRADLHRLFDAGLFTFNDNGQVVIPAQADFDAFDAYRKLLRNKRLPPQTLERVRETLLLKAFKERMNAKNSRRKKKR